MRRAIGAGLALALLAPASAHAAGFKYGVASGEVKPTSVKLWTRADKPGKVTVWVGTSKKHLRKRATVAVGAARDQTTTVPVYYLKPDTRYFYVFKRGHDRSTTGRFRTAPSAKADKAVHFAWSGDADAQPLTPGAPPFWNSFGVYKRMADEGNAFNINLGDTIYSDSEVGAKNTNGEFVPSSPPALTVAAKDAKYKQNLALPALQKLRSSGSVYSQWDDHEFINDFTVAEQGRAEYAAGVKAFREYAPVSYNAKDGTYRSFRWGRNLQMFILDERSFRSAKASANHVCDNPQTGQPDLGPTAPPDKRALFSAVIPSFTAPVSPACLAAINAPNRTMLGAHQYKAFTKAIKKSTATWKVIINEVPIQQFYALPYDRWEGYAAERTKLLRFLSKHVKNTVFLTTDVHANFVNDARFQTLEPGGVKNSGILDITTGPVATRSFDKEIDEATGKPGSGDLITKLFFKPQPPAGVGMSCASPDVFSYGQVDLTRKKLTVHLKDINGKPVVDNGTGKPCAPVVLKRK